MALTAVLTSAFSDKQGSSLFLSTSQTAGLIVLMSGCIEGNKQAPKREFFNDNKEGWVGDIIAAKM